jgi:hypothetical protein
MPLSDMPAVRAFLVAVLVLSSPAVAVAGDSEGVSQFRTYPFGEFDLTVIGIVLVAVMLVLGVRSLARRRRDRE